MGPPTNEGGVVLERSDRCPYCNEPLILHDIEDYFGIRIWVCESVPRDVLGVVMPKAPDG